MSTVNNRYLYIGNFGKTYFVYKICLFLLLLQSFFAWFTWGDYNAVIFATMPILFGIIFMYTSKVSFIVSPFNVASIVLFAVIQVYSLRQFEPASVGLAVFRTFNVSFLIMLSDDLKIDIFDFFSKLLAFIFGISLFFWILFLVGINLPNYSIISPFGDYLNFYFFLKFDDSSFFSIIPRFQSVFLEPSYLGMLTTFLIISNRFDITKIVVNISVWAAIFSFSLATYIVLATAYTAYLLLYSKRLILNLLILLVLIYGLYTFSLNFNTGENAVYNYLFKRLDVDNGDLFGSNRFSADLELYYRNFMNNSIKYYGIGHEEFGKMIWEGGNAGYKVFIIQYGIIGVLIAILFYITVLFRRLTKLGWILFIAYFLFFVQASYPYIEGVLFIFITAVPKLGRLQSRKVSVSYD